MNPERFKDKATGKLMKIGQGEAAYWAFVPSPLPPDLTYDPPLVSALSQADRALGELAGLGRTMPNPQLLMLPFMHREAVLSSRIEGTQAEIADLYAYEAGQMPGPEAPPEADVREVLNYVHALEFGLKRVEELPVSLRLLRELHERLLERVRGEHATPGEFRRSQNWIGSPGCTLADAEFVPPPVPEMQDALDAFEKYLHTEDTEPPLIRLAFIHYQFEATHPFLDGNGRIGRLLISLLLQNWGLLPQPLLYLSVYFERHRREYYDGLLAVSQSGAWRDWAQFFLRGVGEQARDAVARAKRLQDLQLEWHRRLKGARSVSVLRLADNLFESPVVTIPRVAQTLGITYLSAQRSVDRLMDAGVLQQIGAGRYGRAYSAGDILEIVAEGAH